MLMQKTMHVLRLWHNNLKAMVSRYLVTRQVTKVLRLTHAQELAHTPSNEWPLVMRKQAEEIRAVASGRIDPIDRRSWAYPYLPEALHRLNQPILKNTPYNLRRFSETPVPRRAINLIKNALLSFRWQVIPITEEKNTDPERELRIQIVTECLKRPNNTDSFRDLFEAVLEDFLIGGYGCIEPRVTPYWRRPFKLWAVDGSTIRIFLDWSEGTPDRPRYAQMTGLKGERGIVTFLNDELIYIRDNVRTNTPFGLGKLEIAFNAVNAFIGAQEMASRAGADQVHKTWLWWEQTVAPGQQQTVRRHILNELEGQAKISLMSGLKKPEVIDVQAVNPEDLLLDWQEFLIRIIACGFDLSPLALGLERDVNRNTGEIMAASDFRNAVVPVARRIEEVITRQLIQGILGFKDLQLSFVGLEDPDSMTRAQIQRIEYSMDAITPDEIREQKNLSPLPGGWGRLTFTQKQLITTTAAAKLGGGAGQPGAGPPGAGGGMPPGMGTPRMPGMGTPSIGQNLPGGSMRFAAQEVAGMSPEEVQMYQELGVLPPTQQLVRQMVQQEPSILETISDELRQFFEHEEALEEETEVQPAPITPEMEQYQRRKFVEVETKDRLLENVINKRGTYGPSTPQDAVRKKTQRGKYPQRTGKNNPYAH